jgi:hypothetical protein
MTISSALIHDSGKWKHVARALDGLGRAYSQSEQLSSSIEESDEVMDGKHQHDGRKLRDCQADIGL